MSELEKIRVDVPRTEPKGLPAITRGLFARDQVREMLLNIYGEDIYQKMIEQGVDKRMVFATNAHYHALAMGEELRDESGRILVPKMPPSKAIAALILPRLQETEDMSGAKDPSNQLAYSPDEYHGLLLHKYPEIVLGFASPVCSAHCRYCYRLDLFEPDSEKGRIQPEVLRDYILEYNRDVKNKNAQDKNGRNHYPVRELLLSGGDVLTLTNALIARYAKAGADAGVDTLRFGTKEIAFRPERIDDAFIEMLKTVHKLRNGMKMNFVVHFTHPDEFLERDADGNYIPVNDDGTELKWMDASLQAVERLKNLSFVTMENQSPIISHVNDNSDYLHILHAELSRMGIKPKYMFQGRDIQGHAAFSLPVEETWRIHNEAMKGLSDGARSRLVMSTEWGKMEVVSVMEGYKTEIPEQALRSPFHQAAAESVYGKGTIKFKLYRAADMDTQGREITAQRDPEALWFSDYEEKGLVLIDGRDLEDPYKGLRGAFNRAYEAFNSDGPHVVEIPPHLMRGAVLLDLQEGPDDEEPRLVIVPGNA